MNERQASTKTPDPTKPLIGLVAIGRNEGERLERCLRSIVGKVPQIVYVDSGSTDSSVQLAESMGVAVVPLDMTQPFSAARARNSGFQRLMEVAPQTEFVQFIDGDCEVASDWFQHAVNAMQADDQIAVVCGRRREKSPDRSIYNRLCDMEWNSPVGYTRSCGGDSFCRVTAFRQCGGFDPACVAGEEPELCVRLRKAGWKVFRVNAEMTSHDADMSKFKQWWRRSVRAGHAYAQGKSLHGSPPECHGVKESRSIWFWALLFPLALLLTALPTKGLSLLGFLAYPVMVVKIARYRRNKFGDSTNDCLLYGLFCVAGKWAQLIGQIMFKINSARRRGHRIIEYK